MGGKSIKARRSYSDRCAAASSAQGGFSRRGPFLGDEFLDNLHCWLWMREHNAVRAILRYQARTPKILADERKMMERLLFVAERRRHLKAVFVYAILGNCASAARVLKCDVKTIRLAWNRLCGNNRRTK